MSIKSTQDAIRLPQGYNQLTHTGDCKRIDGDCKGLIRKLPDQRSTSAFTLVHMGNLASLVVWKVVWAPKSLLCSQSTRHCWRDAISHPKFGKVKNPWRVVIPQLFRHVNPATKSLTLFLQEHSRQLHLMAAPTQSKDFAATREQKHQSKEESPFSTARQGK